jgi:DNA-directed RNA polymerase subunit H (RpoH/RPB5)
MTTNNSSILISQIYKSRKILLELLLDQDYVVDEYTNFSINEVNSMYLHNQLDMLLEKTEIAGSVEGARKQKIYISYYLGKTIKPANISEMIDDLFNLEEVLTVEDTLMIITKENMNETMTNFLKHTYEKEKKLIIIQCIKNLQFNILNNVLVPKHRVLSDEEVRVVKLKYNITDDTQFPDISRFDPVAKVIGIRPGQICEIIRPSKTAIDGLYYRICI